MSEGENSALLGPTMFFGLSIYVLVTSSPAEIDYANPADLLDLDTVTRAAVRDTVGAYFPDQTPVETQPPAPQAFAATHLADPEKAEPIAQVSTVRVIPALSLTPQTLPRAPEPATLVLPLPQEDAEMKRGDSIPVRRAETGKTYKAKPHEWFVVTGALVNLRSGPGLEFDSITQFDEGIRGLKLGSQGGWIQIQFLGNVSDTDTGAPLTGWMFAGYLRPEPR